MKKRAGRVMWVVAGLLGTCAATAAFAQTEKAEVSLVDARGKPMGRAILTETEGGAKIFLQARGISPGTHAFHIHAVGRCDPPDFKSAGPHFNPFGKKHGAKNPQGAHAGDLSNIVVGASGTIQVEVLAKGVTLSGTGENSLFHEGGTSLVIHADPDDGVTDPAGNAGARIACGVIVHSQ